MPLRTINHAGHGAGKTHSLALVAREALHAGTPAAEMLALAPRSSSAAALREMLHGLTGHDIPTTTARVYALRLLASAPQAVALPPNWSESDLLSGIDRRLLIRHACAEAGAADGSLWMARGAQPGALDWIGRLFDRWSAWAGTADPRRLPPLEIAHPGVAELWRAYRLYLQLCRQLGVVAFAEVWNRAADLLRVAEAQPRPLLLLLDDLDLFQPDELQLVELLAGVSCAVAGACADAPDHESPLAARRWLARWAERLELRSQSMDTPGRTPAVTGGEYASPDEEAEAIARRIAAGGGSPSDYAVVLFDGELLPLLRRALRGYGIPLAGDARDATTLAIAPWARAALALLAGDEPEPVDLLRLLRDPALGLHPADARVAVEAAHDGALRIGARPRLPGGLSPDGRDRLRRLAVAARAMSAGLPSQRLRRWLARTGVVARCDARTTAALGADAAAVDRRLWQRWLGFLERSESLHEALGTPLDASAAAEVLQSAQALVEPEEPTARSSRPEEPHAEPAVAVWQPGELGGRVATTVFVAGLHEGALPKTLPALPFAGQLDRSWEALPNFVAPAVDDRRAAWARGEEELRRAIGRAYGAVHCSYSRADRDGRRRLASPLLAASLGAELDRHGRLLPGTAARVETELPSPDRAARPLRDAAGAMLGLPLALPDLADDESPYVTSPSALEDYFTCPRRCFYARRLGLYDVRSSARQALGMAVHHALDDLLAEAPTALPDRPEAPPGRPEALPAGLDPQHVAELVARHWSGDDRRWGSALRREVFRRLAERAVANVARYEAERGAARFFGAELPFEWMLGDVVIRGRLDRVDRDGDGLHVVDYKLGRESPSLATLLAEFVPPADEPVWRPGDIQLPVYALALEAGAAPELAGERVADITLVYPLDLYNERGKPSVKGRRELRIVDHQPGCPACEQPPARWTSHGLVCRRQLAQIQERLLQAVAAMRRGEWPADPRDGAQTCAFCAFRPICGEAR